MKKMRPLLWAALLFLVIGGSAFQVREKGRKPGPDWSRSIPLGVFVRGDIDIVVEPDGHLVHLIWLKEVDGRNRVHYVQLNDKGETQLDKDLELPDTQLRLPQILPVDNGGLHLLWLSRPDGRRAWDLQYVQIDQNGELDSGILQLAPPDQDVAQFTTAAAGDDRGGFFVAWESEAEKAIFGSHIAADGTLAQDAVRLVNSGSRPSLAYQDGTLYLTWLDGFEVMFATMPQGELNPVDGVSVESIPLNPGKDLDGPEIAIAGDWAYVIWSIFNSTGLEAGAAATEYIAFPKDSPQRINAQRLRLSAAEEPSYAAYESAYQITQLAPPAETSESTDFVDEPALAASRGTELAVAVAMNQDFRLDSIPQIGLVIFKDGQFQGYQMAGKTESFSQAPSLAVDGQGNLYAAWREGGQASVAFYGVTSPTGVAALDRFRAEDAANIALSGGIEALAGVLFFPLACIWLLPGLVLIGLWHLWRGDSNLHNKGTIIVLVISIIVSQFMKILFLPTITTYVPFSAWFDVSLRWEQILLFAVPMITMLVGLLVAYLMRRRTPSGLAFFFWFTATDAVLTLAIYGVTILGVF